MSERGPVDHVTDAIDRALHDYAVSPDAMRMTSDGAQPDDMRARLVHVRRWRHTLPHVEVPEVPHVEVPRARRSIHDHGATLDFNRAMLTMPPLNPDTAPRIAAAFGAFRDAALDLGPALERIRQVIGRSTEVIQGAYPPRVPDDPRERALHLRQHRSDHLPREVAFRHRGRR